MHFSLPDLTIRMISPWVPEKEFIAIVTGMIEVTVGVLLLVPSVRRWAALVSLIFLTLYIPAVYQILSDDLAAPGGPLLETLFRIVLIPNNIFLGVCSVYLWRHPNASHTRRSYRTADGSVPPAAASAGMGTLLVAVLLLVSNCAGYLSFTVGLPSERWATASLWAMMCIATGALLGFLFAVPKVNPNAKTNDYLIPNTNIESVSDWLTKILVGVGLVNFGKIGEFITQRSIELAMALQSDKSLALSLIVYFFVVGLIQGYLLTRMFLSWQFSLQMQSATLPQVDAADSQQSQRETPPTRST